MLLNLWQTVAQGRVRLRKPVRNLLFYLVERWPDLVRNQHDPDVPAPPTVSKAGSAGQAPGPPGTGFWHVGGHPSLVRMMARGMA